MKRLTVVGAGPGSEELLTGRALECIRSATRLFCTDRLYERLGHLNPNSVKLPFSKIIEALMEEDGGDRPVLLASGDVGFYSISSLLRSRLPGWEIVCENGLSSLQYFCARLGVAYDHVETLSVHGRAGSAVPAVSYSPRVFILTGGERRAQDVVAELCAAGLGAVRVYVGENLSAENERIVSGTAADMEKETFDSLAVMLVENEAAVDPQAVLRDSDFSRGKVPMTKQEVRDVSLVKLDIRAGDTVWDVGAGTGSVSVAMARRASRGMVYAVEKKADAVALLRENREKLGAFNICPVEGEAPGALDALPAPDKVFIGGSSGNMREIFRVILEKNPEASIVVNAITLETLGEAVDCFEAAGRRASVCCLNTAVSEIAGRYHMMKAQNPVYIISETPSSNRDETE